MTDDPRLTPLAASLPPTIPFVGPEELERRRGSAFKARLGANESIWGPSPKAIQAMGRAAADAWQYGDSTAHDLRNALAAHHGIGPEHIMAGEGIDGLLGVLVRLTVSEGAVVVTSDGAYPTFNYHVAGFGGRLIKVPFRDDHEDPEALVVAAGAHDARLVYMSNPDNPMGTWHGADRIAGMLDDLPGGCLLVLDEAYADFAPPEAIPPLAPQDTRLIRMRTFSKAYGLAGARVGYAIGPAPLISAFDRVRNHFGLSRVSQAGAEAALADRDWLDLVKGEVTRARARIAEIAAAHGLAHLPSATNFVAIDCGGDGDLARAVLQELEARGVFVRMPGPAPLDRCIRVTCGPEDHIAAFAAAFGPALEAARNR